MEIASCCTTLRVSHDLALFSRWHALSVSLQAEPRGRQLARHVGAPQPSSAQSCCCVLAWMMALLFIASFQRPPTSELPGSSTRASLQLYQQPGCCQQSGCDCPGQNQSTVQAASF